MVKKLIYIALFCSCLLWAGCSSSSQIDSITVKVDLDVEGCDSVEHLLSVSCLVPLQANGMVSSVDKVCMMDSLIYVLDQKQMALFIFNKEGYLRHTLKKLGRASGEYLSLSWTSKVIFICLILQPNGLLVTMLRVITIIK